MSRPGVLTRVLRAPRTRVTVTANWDPGTSWDSIAKALTDAYAQAILDARTRFDHDVIVHPDAPRD